MPVLAWTHSAKRKVDHMNAADLIERVATEHGIAKEHVKKVLDSVSQ